jgi:hypothetical protein
VRSRSVISNAIPQLWHKFPTYRAYAAAGLTDIFDAQALRNSLRLVATEFRTGVLVNRSTPERLSFEWQPLEDIAQISPGFGVAVGDFSGDGRTDALLAQNLFTREPETGLWRGGLGQLLCGTADGKLGSIPPRESGVIIPGDAKGAATIDLGADGRPDALIAQNNDALLALQNEATGSWLILRLIGSNGTAAIGARATIRFHDGSSCTSELCAGGGYLSQSAPEIYLGLAGRRPRQAEITWPSGNRQTLSLDGKSGRITLKEPN